MAARGFLQMEGIDFSETYAPVVKFISIRMILSITAVEDIHLHLMDVKTTILIGYLEESVFIEQPNGFAAKEKNHLVYRLKKAIYGLCKAP